MNTQPFLCPRLTGARFEGHAIPLEFLKDLAVLEEMIVEGAKAEFLREHRGRQRVPQGFTTGIELKLTGIEEGSAALAISLDAVPDPEFSRQYQTYFNRRDAIICFERARDAIVGAIGAAEQNQSFADYLPKKILRYFGKFGRSLRDDEAIEFTSPTHDIPTKLTKKSRQRLVLASSEDNRPTGRTSFFSIIRSDAAQEIRWFEELTKDIAVRGTVPEADQDKMTFEIQLIARQKVKAPIPLQHLGTILEAFSGYKNGVRVLLQGIGRFNRAKRLLSFDSIEQVSILNPLDISAQLDELRLMKNGWLEGEGLAPPREGLDWLSQVFDDHYPENLPLPYLYPTEEGGVQAEWSFKQNEVSLRIDLGNHAGGWHALNMETDADDSCTLDLDNVEDWNWIGTQIQRMRESQA